MPRPELEVIAHRGFSAAAPENTLAAFERAIAVGADRIELDLQLAADGGLVIFHDTTLERTSSGRGPLWRMDTPALQALDAGSWHAPRFRGERIPRLDEALDLCRGRIALNVELKVPEDPLLPAGYARRLGEAAARALEGELSGPAPIVSSFDPEALASFGDALPSIEREALLLEDAAAPPPCADILDALDAARAAGAAGLNLSWLAAASCAGLVEAARARGMRVKVYTIDATRDLERAIAAGVDGIFTNRPDLLLRLLCR